MRIIEDGNLTDWMCTVLIVAGAAISYLTVEFATPSYFSASLALLGFAAMAIGGLCGRARFLKIRPFGTGYKKARESYETQRDKEHS